MAGNRMEYILAFTADTKQAKAQMKELQEQLSDLMKGSFSASKASPMSKELSDANVKAAQLKAQLSEAMNINTGKLNLTKFNASLKASGTTIEDYRIALNRLGPEGGKVFTNLATSIISAETPLVSLGKRFQDLGKTFKNTISWQISSSIANEMMGTFRSAINYAENLNKSLNDIRIVTGLSSDEMADFADKANKAAKSLGATTLKYTEASLIYYQQGLSSEEVEERTNTTIKMANVTGESASNVSSYMTAIWNNFDDGSKSLEYYSDVITALGAATAASSEEIANGLQKFAAIGSTVGLSYEYATAALTTIVDKTRQSEDVVGNALKTIFARVQGLQQGETQEDGVTLNKYSKALENVGIQIIGANGDLKEMDTILDELGSKWGTLGKAQKVALAQTVGGTRQYAQLISLMDNWDAFKENVQTAQTSEGTLQEQADIYAESWQAASARVRASMEGIYDSILDDDFFINMTNVFADFLSGIENVVEGLGGMKGMFLLIGSIITTVFQKQAAKAISTTAATIKSVVTGQGDLKKLQSDTLTQLQNILGDDDTLSGKALKNTYDSVISAQQKYIQNASKMSDEEKKITQILLDRQSASIKTISDIQDNSNRIQKDYGDINKQQVQLAKEPAKWRGGIKGSKVTTNWSNQKKAFENTIKYADIFMEESDKKEMHKQWQEWVNLGNKNLTPHRKELNKLGPEIEQKKKEFNILYEQLNDNSSDEELEKLSSLEKEIQTKETRKNSLPEIIKQEEQRSKKLGEELGSFINQKVTAKPDEILDNVKAGSAWNNISSFFGNTTKDIQAATSAMNVFYKTFEQEDDVVKTFGIGGLEHFKTMKEALDKKAPDSEKIEEYQKAYNKADEYFKEMATKSEEALKTLGFSNKDLEKAKKAGYTDAEIYKASAEAIKTGEAVEKVLDRMRNKQMTVSEGFVSMVSTLTQLSMVITQIQGLGSIWTDEDLSVGDKILQTVSSLSMLLPVIVALTKEWKEQKIQDSIVTLGSAMGANLYALKMKILGKAIEQQGKEAERARIKNLGWKASLGIMLGTIAAVVAVLGVLYLAWKNIENLSVEKRIEKANKELENSKKAANDASSAYSELKSAIDSLHSAEDTLKGLTKGTQEWKEAVLEVNQQVLSLIEKYPELSKYVTTGDGGLLGISEEGIEKITRRQAAKVSSYQSAVQSDLINKQKLENEKTLSKEVPTISYTKTTTEQNPTYSDLSKPSAMMGTTSKKETVVRISQEDIDKIAKSIADKKNDPNNFDFGAEGVELDERSKEWKDAVNANMASIQNYAQKMDKANLEIQSAHKDLASSYLSNNTQGLSQKEKNFISTGMSDVAKDNYKKQEERVNKLKDDDIMDITAKSNLGPDATEDEIAEALHQLKEQYKENNDILKTWKESIINRETMAQSYQDTIDSIKGINDPYLKDIVLSRGDKSAYNSFTKNQYDNFKGNNFDNSGKLTSTIEKAIKKALGEVRGQEVVDDLNSTFSEENKERYQKESEEFQQKKFNEEVESTASGLGINKEALDGYINSLTKSKDATIENKKAALETAEANVKWSKGTEKLSSVLKDNEDVLDDINKGTIEYYEALGETTKSASELFGLDLNTEYIEKHLNDFKKAIEGDEKAIKNLQRTAASEGWAKDFANEIRGVKKDVYGWKDSIDDSAETTEEMIEVVDNFDGSAWADEFITALDDVSNYLSNIDPNIEIDVDTVPALNSLIDLTNKALMAGEMTREEMENMFASMGYSPEVEMISVPQQPTDTTTTGKITLKDGKGETADTFEYEGNMKTQTTLQVPQIKDANADGKINMPRITSAPSLSRATKKAPSKSSSGSSGGGGGSSPKEKKNLSDEKERYHTITKTLGSLEKELDKISKAKEKAFGKSKIKLMDEEIARYENLVKAQKKYISEIKSNFATDKGAVEQFGAKIDSTTGVITNYNQIIENAVNKFNNSSRSEEDEEVYNKTLEAIKKYEETLDLLKEEEDKLKDYVDSIAEEKLAKIQYKLEIKIDIEDRELQYLEYLLSKTEDEAFKTAENIANIDRQIESILEKNKAYEQNLKEMFKSKGANYSDFLSGKLSNQDLVNLGFNGAEIDQLKTAVDGLLDNNQRLIELRNNAWEQVRKSVEETIEVFNEQDEKIQHSASVLEHYKNIVDLIGKGSLKISNKTILEAGKASVDNALAGLDADAKLLETLKSNRKKALKEISKTDNEETKKYWEKYLKELDKDIQTAEENMLGSWKEALEKAAEEFKTATDIAIKDFEKAMSGSFGNFERLQDAFNKEKELSNLYLDDYKKIYNLSKLTRDIDKSLDSTNSLKGKQALKDLQEEINSLEAQGVKLSEYDVNNLRAKYELRLAEIALEDAQNAKNQVRMTRDSEGNWNYVYVADEKTMADAEQNYEDKLYAMQELNDNYLETLSSNIIEMQVKMTQELAALDPKDDNYLKKAEEISNYYTQRIEGYLGEMTKTLDNSQEVYDFWDDYHDKTDYGISANENWIDSFEETQLSILTGFNSIEDYHQAFIDALGNVKNGDGLMGKLNNVYSEWSDNVKKAMKTAGTSLNDFKNKMKSVVENNKKDSEKAIKENNRLKTTYQNNMKTIINTIKNWENKNGKAIDSVIKDNEKAVKSVNGLITAYKNLSKTSKNPPKIEIPKAKKPEVITKKGVGDSGSGNDVGGNNDLGNSYNKTKTNKEWYDEGFKDGLEDYSKGRKKYQNRGDKIKNSSYKKGYDRGWDMHISPTGSWGMQNRLQMFDTGGYTGSWGSSGRLAVLHQKELVLNKTDTENMLKAVQSIRAISKKIDFNAVSLQNNFLSAATSPLVSSAGEVVQQITINADFPNATNQNEIKDAFNNLFNMASQYANRKK